MDWIVTQSVSHDGLKKALGKEEGKIDDSHPLLKSSCSQVESFMVHVAANAAKPVIPMDGSHVTTSVISLLPTSRGSVTLSSADPAATPCIDPKLLCGPIRDAYGTEEDDGDPVRHQGGTSIY